MGHEVFHIKQSLGGLILQLSEKLLRALKLESTLCGWCERHPRLFGGEIEQEQQAVGSRHLKVTEVS